MMTQQVVKIVTSKPRAESVIERCPFCGSYEDLPEVHQLSGTLYHVICSNPTCRAVGPGRYEVEAAIQAWNKRPPFYLFRVASK